VIYAKCARRLRPQGKATPIASTASFEKPNGIKKERKINKMNPQKKITVTERDIKKGKRQTATRCPIALAIQRTFPGLRVSVNTEEARIGGTHYNLPDKATAFITEFDFSSHPVLKPFSFRLGRKIAG